MASSTYTRQQWAVAFLNGLGNANPSQSVVNWVINWTNQEGNAVGGQGDFNLLNTTQSEPGSYGGGSQGNIQYFDSFSSGIAANDQVIQNGLYPDLLSALQNNDFNALASGSGNIVSEMGTWGTGWNSWYANTPSSLSLGQQFPLNGSNVGTLQAPTGSNSSSSSSGSDPLGIFAALGLPSSADVANFAQQFMLIFFGGLIILIGVLVVFFSSDSGKKVAKAGAEVAIA
ncbi:MAG: hypothetical protein ACRETA_04500 [Gammaproteobacteria bacterium]